MVLPGVTFFGPLQKMSKHLLYLDQSTKPSKSNCSGIPPLILVRTLLAGRLRNDVERERADSHPGSQCDEFAWIDGARQRARAALADSPKAGG